MSAKHTPGPWVPNPMMLDQICTYGGEPTVVAYAYRDMPADIVIANANLIAAAPELLDALIAITNQLERIGDTREHKDGAFIRDARAAINKATGSAE